MINKKLILENSFLISLGLILQLNSVCTLNALAAFSVYCKVAVFPDLHSVYCCPERNFAIILLMNGLLKIFGCTNFSTDKIFLL